MSISISNLIVWSPEWENSSTPADSFPFSWILENHLRQRFEGEQQIVKWKEALGRVQKMKTDLPNATRGKQTSS